MTDHAISSAVLRQYAAAFASDYRRFTYARDDSEEGERTVEGDLLLIARWYADLAAAPTLAEMRDALTLCPAGHGHYDRWCDSACRDAWEMNESGAQFIDADPDLTDVWAHAWTHEEKP